MRSVTPQQLNALWQQNPSLKVIDVRTPAEYRTVHAPMAHLHPLDGLNPSEIKTLYQPSEDQPVYVLCHSGSRAKKACGKLDAAGIADAVLVEGGTEAWEQAGLPVERGKATLSLMRQSLIGAGVVVWIGLLLGWFVSPWFLAITAFAGCGLIMAGAADICLMAIVLSRMPWNRADGKKTCCTVSPQTSTDTGAAA